MLAASNARVPAAHAVRWQGAAETVQQLRDALIEAGAPVTVFVCTCAGVARASRALTRSPAAPSPQGAQQQAWVTSAQVRRQLACVRHALTRLQLEQMALDTQAALDAELRAERAQAQKLQVAIRSSVRPCAHAFAHSPGVCACGTLRS